MQTRAAALAALLILAGALGGCSRPGGSETAEATDPYAGLDAEILKWRTDIVAADPLCRSQAQGQKCEAFDVACKALRTITPAEKAQGVTVKLVAALTWNGFDPQQNQSQSAVRSAEFSKTGAAWTRRDHTSVNPESCADL